MKGGCAMDANIGLVLSGGMAKGAYEIGALQALSRYFSPGDFKAVSAASIGALNGYAYCSDNLPVASTMWKGLNKIKETLSLRTVLKSEYLGDAIADVSGSPLLCEKFFVPFFRPRDLKTVYLDLCRVPHGTMEDHLKAAVSVLGFMKPYPLEDDLYYDGAVIDNIPVYPLMAQELDYVICIYFDAYNYTFDSPAFDKKVIKITFDDENILANSLWFDRERIRRMTREGEEKTAAVLDFVFANGTSPEAVQERIKALNALHPRRQIRITGDVALNNMNKVAQMLTRKSLS